MKQISSNLIKVMDLNPNLDISRATTLKQCLSFFRFLKAWRIL